MVVEAPCRNSFPGSYLPIEFGSFEMVLDCFGLMLHTVSFSLCFGTAKLIGCGRGDCYTILVLIYIIPELLKPPLLWLLLPTGGSCLLRYKVTNNNILYALNIIVSLHVGAHHMEQDIAILIADLSGYTALTEVHGASTAADIIDTYLGLVQASLVGNSRLHGRTGDEVLIVSDAADALLATGVQLLQRAHRQPEFLQLHGALHYGTVLNRNNDYYGNTVNITSRMASKANAGTMVCSTDFIQALTNKEVLQFRSKGKFNFKNVSEEKEVLELVIDRPDAFFTDPVCRMLVNAAENRFTHPLKPGLFFCSQSCLDTYLRSENNG